MLKLYLLFFSMSLFLYGAYPNYSQAVKEKKIYPMGKKIYQSRCHNQSFNTFQSYDELFEHLQTTHGCGKLPKRYQEALALYIWDTQHQKAHEEHLPKLHVTHKDKCPVCGMFLYKYPQWVSRIVYGEKSYSFDGVKDMMKFYFTHQEGITHIYVQDYYTTQTLDAKKAYFVVGSDVYGPMGNELIGFKTLESAKRFLLDHRGKKIFRFDEISVELIKSLDA